MKPIFRRYFKNIIPIITCEYGYNNDWRKMLKGCLKPVDVKNASKACAKFIGDINKILAKDIIAKLNEFELYYIWNGNAAASFMDYYLSVVNKVQNDFANYLNKNGQFEIEKVNGVIKSYNEEYKTWNKHCEDCKVCNAIFGEISDESLTTINISTVSENIYSSVEGILIYIEFKELEQIKVSLKAIKEELLSIMGSISSLALPAFPGKFSECESSFATYRTNCANKVLDATKEIDKVINRVTEYSDLLKKLNKVKGE